MKKGTRDKGELCMGIGEYPKLRLLPVTCYLPAGRPVTPYQTLAEVQKKYLKIVVIKEQS